MGRVQGKVAVVTGAGGAIGGACAKALVREGASVVLVDLPGSAVVSVTDALAADGGNVLAVEADVSVDGDVRSMLNAAVETFGRLDILHNNAALTDPAVAARDGDVVGLDIDVFDRTIAVNLRGPLLGCKYAVPLMIKNGGGSIVNTSSVLAMYGDLRSVAYAVSKGGLNTLTRSVATQYGKQAIRCNAMAPGTIMTPGVARFFTPELVDVFERHHLSPGLGAVEDVAGLLVYLASDESRFVTGQIISIDGGLCSHMPTVAEFAGPAGSAQTDTG